MYMVYKQNLYMLLQCNGSIKKVTFAEETDEEEGKAKVMKLYKTYPLHGTIYISTFIQKYER